MLDYYNHWIACAKKGSANLVITTNKYITAIFWQPWKIRTMFFAVYYLRPSENQAEICQETHGFQQDLPFSQSVTKFPWQTLKWK